MMKQPSLGRLYHFALARLRVRLGIRTLMVNCHLCQKQSGFDGCWCHSKSEECLRMDNDNKGRHLLIS